MSDLSTDLNTTITAAVNARVEAAVAEALASGGMITAYVTAALSREIEVRDGLYSSRPRKTTFLRETIDLAVKAATEAAVRKVIAEEQPAIEAAVATELRRRTKDLAAQVVGKMAEATESSYGVQVSLRYREGE